MAAFCCAYVSRMVFQLGREMLVNVPSVIMVKTKEHMASLDFLSCLYPLVKEF